MAPLCLKSWDVVRDCTREAMACASGCQWQVRWFMVYLSDLAMAGARYLDTSIHACVAFNKNKQLTNG